mmetsp:Transcript_13940/g.23090  ORF Transcript_13940/g.23090 Transcript_13940/m.23090 type:complete len:302 (-) Transcript_13940:31-936(-)
MGERECSELLSVRSKHQVLRRYIVSNKCPHAVLKAPRCRPSAVMTTTLGLKMTLQSGNRISNGANIHRLGHLKFLKVKVRERRHRRRFVLKFTEIRCHCLFFDGDVSRSRGVGRQEVMGVRDDKMILLCAHLDETIHIFSDYIGCIEYHDEIRFIEFDTRRLSLLRATPHIMSWIIDKVEFSFFLLGICLWMCSTEGIKHSGVLSNSSDTVLKVFPILLKRSWVEHNFFNIRYSKGANCEQKQCHEENKGSDDILYTENYEATFAENSSSKWALWFRPFGVVMNERLMLLVIFLFLTNLSV